MAEEQKNPPQGESMAASDPITDSPHESERNDIGSADQEEAAVTPATNKSKSMEPQDETFWEGSVDASTVNLGDSGKAQEAKEEKSVAAGTREQGNAQREGSEENTTEGERKEEPPEETAAEEQSMSAESEAPQEHNVATNEDSDQLTTEETPQQVKDNDRESVAEKKDETTVDGEEKQAEGTVEGEQNESREAEGPDAKSETPPEESALESSEDRGSVEASDTERGKEENIGEAPNGNEQTPVEEKESEIIAEQAGEKEAVTEGKTTDRNESAEEKTALAIDDGKIDASTEVPAATTENNQSDSEGKSKRIIEDDKEIILTQEEKSKEVNQEPPPDGDEPVNKESGVEEGNEKSEETEEATTVAPEDIIAAGGGKKFLRHPSRKTIMIAAGIILLIIGSIGFSVVSDLRFGDTVTSTFLGNQPENIYDMQFFLPLNVGYKKARFVKVTIAIEFMDKGFKKEIDGNVSRLRKEVIDLLLTKSPQEVKSSKGKKQLRQEITSRLNHYFAKDCIKDTYFTELVIL